MFWLRKGRDLIGVQNLIKKHQALSTEIGGHDARIGTVCAQGDQMIKERHFASDDISTKSRDLRNIWNRLKVSQCGYTGYHYTLPPPSVACMTPLSPPSPPV